MNLRDYEYLKVEYADSAWADADESQSPERNSRASQPACSTNRANLARLAGRSRREHCDTCLIRCGDARFCAERRNSRVLSAVRSESG